MSATIGAVEQGELPVRLARYPLPAAGGQPELSEDPWVVVLSTDGDQIRRDVWPGDKAWDTASEGWEPEGIIWPTWPGGPADEVSSPDSALSGVRKYWYKTGNRLRDSAKWMATVLGAALPH